MTSAAAAATGRLVKGGLHVVYDGVVGPWFLPLFLRQTGLPLAAYAVLLPDVETCVRRVLARAGHGFTDESATRRMHANFTAAELERRHVVRGGSPSEVATELDRGLSSSAEQ